ncbi:hypothetical protein GCM10009646_07980 [Streptomyces aureus]
MAPTIIIANATVTVVVPNPSRAWYIGHSGVGSVPNAMRTVKATAANQKPTPWPTARRRRRPTGAPCLGRRKAADEGDEAAGGAAGGALGADTSFPLFH